MMSNERMIVEKIWPKQDTLILTQKHFNQTPSSDYSAMANKYLVHFLDDWLDFRFAEFISLLSLNNLNPEDVIVPLDNIKHHDVFGSNTELSWSDYLSALRHSKKLQHFLIIRLPNDQAATDICSRAVLVKTIYRLWAYDTTYAQMAENLKQIPEEYIQEYVQSPLSWSVQIQSFGKSFTMEEKQLLRSEVGFLQFQGTVNLKAPELELWVVIDYSQGFEDGYSLEAGLPEKVTYYGHKVATNAIVKQWLVKYDLKKRLYVGPTSLDVMLAFVLSNLAQVKADMLCYEPFLGTGSIAVALAHLQALVLGSDIDPRVLRGEMYAGKDQEEVKSNKSKGQGKVRDVRQNFLAYGLPVPEIVRMDHHLLQRHLLLPGPVSSGLTNDSDSEGNQGYFDAIVTDPPYGIRAGAKKSGKKDGLPANYAIPPEFRLDHIPTTQHYPVEEVMLDLLHTAALTLKPGGLLVYLLPTTYDFTPGDLPHHPCLTLQEVCHQPLSSRHGRRAVLLRKTLPYTLSRQEAFVQYKHSVLAGQDPGFGQLMRKLEIALSNEAFEDDTVIK